MLSWSILQYFWPTLSHNRSREPIFGLIFEWPLKVSKGAKIRSPYVETVLLSTHNICFPWEIRKLNFRYSLLTKVLLLYMSSLNFPRNQCRKICLLLWWCWFVCLFLMLYVPSQQLWSLRDGQFTWPHLFLGRLEQAVNQ